jgi:iron complex transport system substrate-binding protein
MNKSFSANHLSSPYAFIAIFLLLFVACSPSRNIVQPSNATTPSETGVTSNQPTARPSDTIILLTDGLGREIRLDQPAQRVISLVPSNTEILYALGAGAQVVGRDDFSDYPIEATELPSVGAIQDYNLEEIIRLQPDLVLAAGINTPDQVIDIEKLGVNVFWVQNPTNFEELYENLATIAKLVGKEKESELLVSAMKQRVGNVLITSKMAAEIPKVFYELDGSYPAKPWTSGPNTFVDMLIEMAGGVNIGGALQGEWAQISQEELLVQNPDIIILGDSVFGVTVEQVSQRPGWKEIKAVKELRVYEFDDDLVSRPGPRLANGLDELAKIIHNELDSDQK